MPPVEKKRSPEFLTFGKPDIGPGEIEAVVNVLQSGWLSTGPVCEEFEKEFEKYIGSGHAITVSSCTEALMLSLIAAGVGRDDEVIVPPMTFCATVNAVLNVGAKPVFIDVMPNGTLDPSLIQGAITGKTKAIIPVHYTGTPCDMAAIIEESKKYQLTVIEDAAHGFGGSYRGFVLGSMGDFGCFSFYATKNITCGEGGMVITKNVDHVAKIESLRVQGMSREAWKRYGTTSPKSYEVMSPGHKANMSDIHAAIGLTQLKRWPEIRNHRNRIWEVYEKAFGSRESGHSKHLFTIQHGKRDELREFLYERMIGTGIHFKALHLEPAYKFLGYQLGQFPHAEKIGYRTLSLPISGKMSSEDAERVVEVIKDFENTI